MNQIRNYFAHPFLFVRGGDHRKRGVNDDQQTMPRGGMPRGDRDEVLNHMRPT